MNESLKKIFLVGLGVTAAGKEKAEKVLRELSEGGGAAAEEAKSYLTKLNNKGKDKKDQLQNDFNNEIRKTIENLGFVTVDQYNELAERIAALEKNSKTADQDEAATRGSDDQATDR
ncbi:phasin family protein [Sporolactobacillus vineae]|uniref:phasin family protein n=1 Tax=Sporolactobacillus vineae TaxID=444463 RepID=UPI0002897D41|nr:hypothetical protein [Sporolactobacillus vineae]